MKTLKLIIFLTFIPLLAAFSVLSAKAAVPVVVFGKYLDLVKDIDDADKYTPDIQSQITGILEYKKGLPLNTTISYAQKLENNPTDKSDVLNEIVKNINDRIAEIEKEIIQEKKSKTPNTERIAKLEDGIKQLEGLKTATKETKTQLVNSLALDVHIVKDSTSIIEDLKAMARERLARTQLGELATPLLDQFDQLSIKDFGQYLYDEPLQAARDYLDTNFFKVTKPSLPQEDLDSIENAVNNSIAPSYLNPVRPEKDDDFVGLDNVFDESKGGGWDQWLLALEDNHNDYGIYLSALESAQQVYQSEQLKNQTQAIAYQGVRPINDTLGKPIECTQVSAQCPKCENGVCLGFDGQPKYAISKPGSAIAADRAATVEAQFDVAVNPQYAPESSAIGAVGQIPTAPYKDVTPSKQAEKNTEWWGDTTMNSLKALEDIFCACFPDFCRIYKIFSLKDLFPLFKIPDEITICGRTFNLCDYFPEVCDSFTDLFKDFFKDIFNFFE